MIFHQYYLGCLSHASYLVGDETSGRAVVVDPQRDISGYIDDAVRAGLRIERVLETHFHADFVSGHLELAEATGAVISYGAAAGGRTEFAIELLIDGQRLELGEVVLEVRATPGHTPESICVVVYEHAADTEPFAVLTGDTLFIGDVGRPDLLSSDGVGADELGRQLYRSLREQLLTLPDATKVYPAHGAGSSCGKHLSTATVSTIGEQRRTNYALAPMSEQEFVDAVTRDQVAAPLYFSFAAHRNRESRGTFHESDHAARLSLQQALNAQSDRGAAILDTRDPAEFAAGHLAGSINVGLDGRFAEVAGEVVRPGTPIVLVTAAGHEDEARMRLARIGFDDVVGALDQPTRAFGEHPEVVNQASRLTAMQLDDQRAILDDIQIVDVRNVSETADGTVPGAVSIPLPELLDRVGELDPARPTVVYCAGGYRSSIAASTLRSLGFADVSDVLGGYGAWRTMRADG